MQKKNKKQEKQLFFKKIALFLGIVFLAWFNLSRADVNGLNIFLDSDQDGLSDLEEKALGTDPFNPDTDGDGYSDYVEVMSGYDPLKAAPGDKLVINEPVEVKGENTEKEINITDEFIEKIQENNLIKNSPLGEDGNVDGIINGDLDDLNLLLEEVLENQENDSEEIILTEADVKILPKPEGTEEEVKEVEKKQIEKYIASVLYVLAVNKPFVLNDIEELPTQLTNLAYNLSGNVTQGNAKEINSFKEKTSESFNQIEKLEVPYVLKDDHIKTLSSYKELEKNIDIEKLLSDNDPLAIAVYLGEFQSALFGFQEVQQNINNILKEYEIVSFDLTGVLGSEL